MHAYPFSRLLLQLGLLALGSIALPQSDIIERQHIQRDSLAVSKGGCDALAAALPEHVFFPNSSQYLNQSQGS